MKENIKTKGKNTIIKLVGNKEKKSYSQNIIPTTMTPMIPIMIIICEEYQ